MNLCFSDSRNVYGIIWPKQLGALAGARLEETQEILETFPGLSTASRGKLLIGSILINVAGDELSNLSFLVGPNDGIAARYPKIRMFDMQAGDGTTYRESHIYEPDEAAGLADTFGA